MSRRIESYLQYPSEYNPSDSSKINNYVHPKLPNGRDVPNMDYDTRLGDDVRNDLRGYVIQSVTNWPTVNHVELVSDVLNVWPKDVYQTIQDLEEEKVIKKVSEIEYQFEGPMAHPRITKIKETGVSKIKNLLQRK